MRARAPDEFATRVEQALRAGAAPGSRGDEQASLVALAVELRDAARPLAGVVPRQEFRAALAARLDEQARELEPARRRTAEVARRRPVRSRPARPGPRRLRGVLAGAVALVVTAGAGAAVASESALPGGALYPLKRQVEDLRLQLSSPGSARGGTELALARERLVEAEELALASGGADVPATDTPQLRGALDDFGAGADAGIETLTDDYARTGDATSLAAVDTFLDETVPLLERLRTMTPPSVHPVIDDLLATLGTERADLAGLVAGCATCEEIGLVVAVPETSAPPVDDGAAASPSPSQPGAAGPTAAPVPSAPAPPAGGGTGGGALDPLDPAPDPLPPDPVQTLVDDLLPAPQPAPQPAPPGATSTTTTTAPLLPPPSVEVTVPTLLPSPPSGCLLPLPGCP